MHTMASKLAALRLVPAAAAEQADARVERAIRKECAGKAHVAAKRVDSDAAAAAAEIRRIRAESRRRWAERGASIEVPYDMPAPEEVPEVSSLRPYHSEECYAVGEGIWHPAFGDGQVLACGRHRITVCFLDGNTRDLTAK